MAGITNVYWSADSAVLTFQEMWYLYDTSEISTPDTGIPPIKTWHQYFTAADSDENLIDSDTWPYRETNAAILNSIRLAKDEQGREGFTFLSPDQRFVVYPTDRINPYGWPLVIGCTTTGQQMAISDAQTISLVNFQYYQTVLWNSSSSSLMITTVSDGAATSFYYVMNFSENFEKTSIFPLHEGITTDKELHYPIDTFGLSTTGNRVLLKEVTTENGFRLFIWDANDPSVDITVTQNNNVIEAAFLPQDENQILYVGEQGLVLYDTLTQQETILDANISSHWVHHAWISPDGRKIALLDDRRVGQSWLFVVDIPYYAAEFPAASITPTPTPDGSSGGG
ncbi:MAG: hypothetical protein K8I60_07035 [Anaerolineae bacterium]|nr:hypothetical protein [Anaerolineae bacterium]